MKLLFRFAFAAALCAMLSTALPPGVARAAGDGKRAAAEKAQAAQAAAAAAPAPAPATVGQPTTILPSSRGPTRIDFDDRLVQGQTNKLGAVYLYQRKPPPQPSLLSRRTSFRDEISRDLLE